MASNIFIDEEIDLSESTQSSSAALKLSQNINNNTSTSTPRIKLTSSPIWEYCTKIVENNESFLLCNLCTSKFKYCGSPTTFKQHLIRGHGLTFSTNKIITDINQLSDKSYVLTSDDKEIVKKNKSSVITTCLLMFIITACLPFRILENDYFKRLMFMLCPSYKLQTRQTVSTTTKTGESN